MKAIVVRAHGGPEVLKLEEVEMPKASAGQVVVKVGAAGVNPVDTYIRSGNYNNLNLPYTPGIDAAGTITGIGDGDKNLAVGDRVYTTACLTGAYAEYALCEVGKVHRFPNHLSFEQAAGLNIPYATAYRALFFKAQARAGEKVLIHGASGGVGTAALQWAKAAGLYVLATAGTPEGLKHLEQQEADQIFNHREEGYREAILKATGGTGVQIILEMLANVNLGNDLPLLAKNGRVVVIGSRGKVEINPRDLMSRDASITGLTLFNTTPEEYASIHAAIYAGLSRKYLSPVVSRSFELAEAARAHEAVLAPGSLGKIVLVP